jgi:5'(3')-deoxyribonucleotidase
MPRHIIYFDLDGVLADFEEGVFRKTGVDLRLLGDEAFSDKALKDSVFADPAFFTTLAMFPGAKELVEYAKTYGDVKVLSASGYSSEQSVSAQKHAWVKQHLGDIETHIVPKSGDKANFAWPDVILIDDRLEKSIMPFREKGGIGIHHTSMASTRAALDKIFAEINNA